MMSNFGGPKPVLVFLCQRIPYPPIKGDRIATYNFVDHLCSRYRVYLGTFFDEPGDDAGIPEVRRRVTELYIDAIRKPWAFVRALPRWLAGEPISFALFRSRGIGRWLDDVEAKHRPVAVVAYSSNIAAYAVDRFRREGGADPPRILMFGDVDSEKFAAYAQAAKGWKKAIYAIEARRVRREEARLARRATVTTFVTEDEAALFRSVHGAGTGNVQVLPNGVDADLFDPSRYPEAPFPAGGPAFVFTGAMDYPPNVEAVRWFAREVFPGLKQALPGARFMIVGARPTREVTALGEQDGIVVTGRVESTAAYLAHASAAVAPLQIARGIQNKVLEAMAARCAAVVSKAAMTGIEAEDGRHLICAETPAEWIAACAGLARDRPRARRIGEAARALMLQNHAWQSQFARLDRMLAASIRGGRK
jgi:sugar transferase (PEP-CTERM/EpsH1 system associated)